MNKIFSHLIGAPRISALILGALSVLSFAPLYFLPALFVSVWGLLHLLDNARTPRQLFERLYTFGLGFFVAGLYWIGLSFCTIDMGWLGVPAVLALSAFLALFFVINGFFMLPFAPHSIERRIAFAIGFAVCEWLRGHILTGLPWNLTGSIWGAYTWPYLTDIGLSLLQSTAWIGIYGLSFLTIVAVVLITSASRLCRILALAGIIGCALFGSIRLYRTPTELLPVNLRLIQPSLDQRLKWLPSSFDRNIELQLGLSSLEAERPLAAIIWPEAAVTRILNESLELKEILSSIAPKNGYIITGAPHHKDGKIFTTLSVINEKGEIPYHYAKTHLVPFGEYVPFKHILPMDKITPGAIDFSKGDGVKTLDVLGIPPFSPLICYEALFPGEIIDKSAGAKRPEWLLNITNDAWYGMSAGPYQHLALVRIRAIEEGLPLVRVANNGVSAVVDPCGRIVHQLGLNDIGFIDFELPKAHPATVYSRLKDDAFWIFLAVAFTGVMLIRRRRLVNHIHI
ncbi:MAG: apolipoprotein N-acyltransferase [Pseudomonadota bacterium]